MTEKIFYGLWNGKKNYWEHLYNNLGLFTEHLCIIRGLFYNTRQKYDYCWGNVDYQIRRLGEDGLPIGEPLND